MLYNSKTWGFGLSSYAMGYVTEDYLIDCKYFMVRRIGQSGPDLAAKVRILYAILIYPRPNLDTQEKFHLVDGSSSCKLWVRHLLNMKETA